MPGSGQVALVEPSLLCPLVTPTSIHRLPLQKCQALLEFYMKEIFTAPSFQRFLDHKKWQIKIGFMHKKTEALVEYVLLE